MQPLPVLDLGCGVKKHPGAIGMDRNPRSCPDVIADLDDQGGAVREQAMTALRSCALWSDGDSVS